MAAPTNLSVICSICRDLSDPSWLLSRYAIVLEFRLVASAAMSGCETCSLIWQGAELTCNDLGRITHVSINFGDHSDLEQASALQLRPMEAKYVDHMTHVDLSALEFYLDPGSLSPWLLFGAGQEVSADSSSDRCLNKALSWLQECQDEHSQCRNDERGSLPTRVVHVGSETIRPHLYISHGERVPYVALSHRWGNPGSMSRTLESNINARTDAIAVEELPKTFQDAIFITRRLGISYLWIDSLCIIQDSKQDWAQESVKMVSVYSNALVTIAATSASEPSQGCFIPSPGRRRCIKQLGIKARDGSLHKVNVRRSVMDYLFGDGQPGRDVQGTVHVMNLGIYPEDCLESRGWIFQERELSTRLLHFTSIELAWECKTKRYCECMAEAPHTASSSYASGSQERTGILGWTSAVKEFSQRDLTYTTDRPFAFAGVAATLIKPGAKYYCGIRGDHIIEDLAWCCLYPNKYNNSGLTSTRQPKYVAPSFSWYAVTGVIMTDISHKMPLSPLVEIVEVFVKPVNDQFSAAERGHIILQGRVVPLRIRLSKEDSLYDLIREPVFLAESSTEETSPLAVPLAVDVFELSPRPKGEFALVSHGIDLNEQHFGLILGWTPKSGFHRGDVRQRPGTDCVMLVCRRSGLVPDAFERVGITRPAQYNYQRYSHAIDRTYSKWAKVSQQSTLKLV